MNIIQNSYILGGVWYYTELTELPRVFLQRRTPYSGTGTKFVQILENCRVRVSKYYIIHRFFLVAYENNTQLTELSGKGINFLTLSELDTISAQYF